MAMTDGEVRNALEELLSGEERRPGGPSGQLLEHLGPILARLVVATMKHAFTASFDLVELVVALEESEV